MNRSIPRLTALALAAAALPALATELRFEITGVESAEGQVLVALYDEARFLKAPLRALRLKPATKLEGTFGDLPPGAYAVSVVHDENGNGKLDSNLVGLPVEKYGFSNNPVLFGPPGFKDARFEVNGASQSVAITVR